MQMKAKKKDDKADSSNTIWVLAALVITFIAYISALKNGFTNWDDEMYITTNTYISSISFENISAMFSHYWMANYHPLSMLSLAIDYAISGFAPWTFHFTNIVLHLICTAFVYLIANQLIKDSRLAFLIAFIFGVHTIHVESVSWVSERKDVLYSMFFLASIGLYNKYILNGLQKKYLIYSLLFFLLSLLSKGQAVSLAITILLIDLYHNRNLKDKNVIAEKIPYIILALLFGIIAIYAQQSMEAIKITRYPFYERIAYASFGFVNYVFKIIYPYNLSAFYPYPSSTSGAVPPFFWIFPILSLIFLISAIRLWKNHKLVAFGMFFFMINIFLVLQLLPVGDAIMADRYAYIPSFGIILTILAALYHFVGKTKSNKTNLFYAFLIYGCILTVYTYQRNKVWNNSISLWSDVLIKNDKVIVAWYNRGNALKADNKFSEAINDYTQTIKLDNGHVGAINNRGLTRQELKDYRGAISDFSLAHKTDSNHYQSVNNRGFIMEQLGKNDSAILDYELAMKINKSYPDPWYNMGTLMGKMGRLKESIPYFDKAIELKSNDPQYFSNRAIAKASLGMQNEAIKDFSRAIQINPSFGNAWMNRAIAYLNNGQKGMACRDIEKAKSLEVPGAYEMWQKVCNANKN